jgi:hypothetical protein
MSDMPKVVGPEYLVPLVHRSIETVKVDARRKPDSLPPRLKIPGSTKLLWIEADVIEWINGCRTAKEQEPANKSLFRGRKQA